MLDQSVVVARGPLVVRIARAEDAHVLGLFGELDIGTATLLDRELRRVEALAPGRIVVDLSGLAFLDSTGLQTLLQAHRRSRRTGGGLSLLRGRPDVQRVFEMTEADAILHFED